MKGKSGRLASEKNTNIPTMEKEKNLILKVTEYAFSKNHFTLNQLIEDLGLSGSEKQFLRYTLLSTNQNTPNPNHIISILEEVKKRPNDPSSGTDAYNSKYILLPNAYFSYIDHLEIIESRKAAKESKRLAWIAIMISTLIGLASIIIQVKYAK